MERTWLGGLDGGILRPGAVVMRAFAVPAILALVFLSGCYDPFGPVTPEAPTAASIGKGSKTYSAVPVDFGNALDSAQSERIGALLTGSVMIVNGVATLPSAQFNNCLDSLLSPRQSKLLLWVNGTIAQKLSTIQDTAVETFDYSLSRDGVQLATGTATWTVVRIGTEWKLQLWTEGASDLGWIQLCRSLQ